MVDRDVLEREVARNATVVDYSDLNNPRDRLKPLRMPESTTAVKKLKLNHMRAVEKKKLQQKSQEAELAMGCQALDTMTVTSMHALEEDNLRRTQRGGTFDASKADASNLPRKNFRIKHHTSITPEKRRELDTGRLNTVDEAKSTVLINEQHQIMFQTQ